MKRLIEKIVRCGFVTAWRLAGAPTRRAPFSWNATTEGVRREPSRFWMTFTSPPSITETTEFVVPRSMPTILVCLLISLVGPHGAGRGGSNPVPAPLATQVPDQNGVAHRWPGLTVCSFGRQPGPPVNLTWAVEGLAQRGRGGPDGRAWSGKVPAPNSSKTSLRS